MRRGIALAFLISCGGSSGSELSMHTSFAVTSVVGAGTSPLDPLANETIDIDIVWTAVNSNTGAGSDPAGCKTQVLFGPAVRTANGSTATLVQTQILDLLADWDVRLQLCDASVGKSSIAIDAAINELNLAFGCFGIPASAQKKGGDGYPLVTSFTATECAATILDVVNNRQLSNTSFSLTLTTGPDALP